MPTRLEEPVLGVLYLDAEHGFSGVTLDFGFPTVREVVEDRPNANGVDDQSALYGSRAVSITALVMGTSASTRRVLLERVRAYCNPTRRPVLYWDEGDGVERRAVLRGSSAGAPLQGGLARQLNATWSCPSGVLEAAALLTVEVTAGATPEAGIILPTVLPHTFPTSSVSGTTEVRNGDVFNADADHVTQLWGPAVGPRLVNVTTGLVTSFPTVTLSADQYIEVDTTNPSARLNGRPDESLWGYQEPGVSDIFQLVGGLNLLRYSPTSFSGQARAVVSFRPATL